MLYLHTCQRVCFYCLEIDEEYVPMDEYHTQVAY
jgi:hypothetical protein